MIPDPAEGPHEPKDNQNNQNQAEHSAETARPIAIVAITSAPEEQEQHDDNKNCTMVHLHCLVDLLQVVVCKREAIVSP